LQAADGRPASRILIVEDDEYIRALACAALADDGYDVLEAANGAAALDLIKLYPPSLIILDMNMPVMNGWEFVRRYRQLPFPHAPIIVFTAAGDAALRAAEIDASGILGKPFDLDDLSALVRKYVQPSRPRRKDPR
jgi:CheY-like chemotaxis protein